MEFSAILTIQDCVKKLLMFKMFRVICVLVFLSRMCQGKNCKDVQIEVKLFLCQGLTSREMKLDLCVQKCYIILQIVNK